MAVVAGGLLCGWWGLAGVLVAICLGAGLRRFQGWPVLAGLSVLVASLALAWGPITDRSWAVTWSQGWSLAALCCAVAGLAALRRLPQHRADQEHPVTVPRARRGHSTVAPTGRALASMRAKNRTIFARMIGRSNQ